MHQSHGLRPARQALILLLTIALICPLAAPAQAGAPVLTDIADHWAAAEIALMCERGVVAGYEDGAFRPDRAVTRAEFALMLLRAAEVPLPSYDDEFPDVKADDWFAGAAAAASQLGIILGYDDDTFQPRNQISRNEVAVMLSRALDLAPAEPTTDYADPDSIPAWASGEVAAVSTLGYLKGYEDGSFRGSGKLSRAEAAVILSRITDLPEVVAGYSLDMAVTPLGELSVRQTSLVAVDLWNRNAALPEPVRLRVRVAPTPALRLGWVDAGGNEVTASIVTAEDGRLVADLGPADGLTIGTWSTTYQLVTVYHEDSAWSADAEFTLVGAETGTEYGLAALTLPTSSLRVRHNEGIPDVPVPGPLALPVGTAVPLEVIFSSEGPALQIDPFVAVTPLNGAPLSEVSIRCWCPVAVQSYDWVPTGLSMNEGTLYAGPEAPLTIPANVALSVSFFVEGLPAGQYVVTLGALDEGRLLTLPLIITPAQP